MVRVGHLLGREVHWLGTGDLMEAHSQVASLAGITILLESVELGLLIHLALGVHDDSADDKFVGAINSVEISEVVFVVYRIGQLLDRVITEFDQLHRSQPIDLLLIELQIVIQAGSISHKPGRLERSAIAHYFLASLAIFVSHFFFNVEYVLEAFAIQFIFVLA